MSRELPVHPNSMAARKWGKTTWTSTLTEDDLKRSGASGKRQGVQYTSRDAARAVACPRCRALPGNFCDRRNGEDRARSHPERHTAAINAGARVEYRAGKPVALRKRRSKKR